MGQQRICQFRSMVSRVVGSTKNWMIGCFSLFFGIRLKETVLGILLPLFRGDSGGDGLSVFSFRLGLVPASGAGLSLSVALHPGTIALHPSITLSHHAVHPIAVLPAHATRPERESLWIAQDGCLSVFSDFPGYKNIPTVDFAF